MAFEYIVLRYIHLISMAFGVGGSTLAMIISRKIDKNPEIAPIIMELIKPVSKLIRLGLILLILSGLGFMVLGSKGYIYQPFFLAKMLTVSIISINAILMKFVLNPKLRKLIKKSGSKSSPELLKVKKYIKLSNIISLVAWYLVVAFAVLMIYY